MRGILAVLLVGCGSDVPPVPATLGDPIRIAQITPDTPATFDSHDALVMMDGSSGLRRLNGNRLDVVPNTGLFSFGRFGVDRDGTLLLGSLSNFQLGRIDSNDQVTLINPGPPTSFDRLAGTPSGAYWLTPQGATGSFTLPMGGTQWVQSTRLMDRTLWTPDAVFSIEDGDVVTLAADDSPQVVASCAEFAGGTCPDLQLAGVDGQGAIHLARRMDQTIHILDPLSATYREVTLPGKLTIEALAAGLQYTLVIAIDPDRNDERSLWLLPSGDAELLRFAPVPAGQFGQPPHLLVDHAGNGYVVIDDNLQAVVLE